MALIFYLFAGDAGGRYFDPVSILLHDHTAGGENADFAIEVLGAANHWLGEKNRGTATQRDEDTVRLTLERPTFKE
jgi:hypothetical protein